MPKISVIIPVYNIRDYLKDCIDSVLGQDFTDYEIILINDGSTDDSGKICDEYSMKYNFIKVCHKINGGLSSARNRGIDMAKGPYVLFVDGDDYIGGKSLSKISETLDENPEVDVVLLNGIKLFPQGRTQQLSRDYDKDSIFGKPPDDVLDYLSRLDRFPGSACTKLVKRKLIVENNIYFKEKLLSEDIDWTLQLFGVAKVYNYCDYPYYVYRQRRDGSITDMVGVHHLEMIISLIKTWSKPLGQEKTAYDFLVNTAMSYQFMVVVANLLNIKGKERLEICSKLEEVKWVLSCSNNVKAKYTAWGIRIFGIKHIALMYNILLRYKYRR